jgi:hypothetical protein
MSKKMIKYFFIFSTFALMLSNASASPKGEILENILKFFAKGSQEAIENNSSIKSVGGRTIFKETIQKENNNEVKNGLSEDYILSHMPEGYELNQIKSKLKGNLDCSLPQEMKQITSVRSLKNAISNTVARQTPEQVRQAWQSIIENDAPFMFEGENGNVLGSIIPYLFGAADNCKGIVVIRVLEGKTSAKQDEAIAGLMLSPPYQLMDDVCNPMRISWMKNYGYLTEDYVVNSQFKIISSNVIGYEQCVSDDLKRWREFMATK